MSRQPLRSDQIYAAFQQQVFIFSSVSILTCNTEPPNLFLIKLRAELNFRKKIGHLGHRGTRIEHVVCSYRCFDTGGTIEQKVAEAGYEALNMHVYLASRVNE